MGLKVGIFRSDNGELKFNAMADWFRTQGTQHQMTAPYTSAHLGLAEQVHRTLHNKVRTMRIHCDLPPNRWDELVNTACYLTVHTPSCSLPNMTPYEAFVGIKPNLSHLREIGACAFVLVLNQHNPKLYQCSVKCVLIGYEANSKAYRCYHQASHKVFSLYHVTFIESHQGISRPVQIDGMKHSDTIDNPPMDAPVHNDWLDQPTVQAEIPIPAPAVPPPPPETPAP